MEAPAQEEPSLKAGAMAQVADTGPGPWQHHQRGPALHEEEHGEGLVELHTSFRELLAFFCSNSTIHGTVRLVCSRHDPLKTASWGLLLLGALGALCWQLGLLLEQYWRYPVTVAVSVHSERKLFPSVTLCDMNPPRPSPIWHHLEALDAFAQENIYSLYKFNFTKGSNAPPASVSGPKLPVQLDRGIRLQLLRHLDGQHKAGFRLCNSSGSDCFHRTYSSGVTAAQEWYRFHYMDALALLPSAWENGQQSNGGRFILSCRYDSKDCQARHFQMSHHPTYGSCHTFKSVWAAQHPGITHGVSLVLRTEQQHHLPLLSTGAGVKVMVHGHNHTPFLEHLDFSIRPGTETTIGIQEDVVHRLGSPYGHCTDGAEGVAIPLLYNTSYTRQACLVSCFQKLMVETCSCGYHLYPLPPGAQYCSHTRHPAWGHCFYRLHGDLETHQLPCVSSCPRPCREYSYKLSAGTSRWPSAKSANWVLAVFGKWGLQSRSHSHSRRSSVAKVNIFYQELNYQAVDEAPMYSIPQLLSAMGSLCSLWFGSSVLSILELLELLLDAVALAFLLGFHRLCRAQRSQPGVSTALVPAHTRTEAGLKPGDCRHASKGPGGPAGSHLPQALEGVLAEEIG